MNSAKSLVHWIFLFLLLLNQEGFSQEVVVPLMPEVKIDFGQVRKLSEMYRDPSRVAYIPQFLSGLRMEVVVVPEKISVSDGPILTFYRDEMSQTFENINRDTSAQEAAKNFVVKGIFYPAFDHLRPSGSPLRDKDVMVLAHNAGLETLLHETLHFLINDYFVRSRLSRLHPRQILYTEIDRLAESADTSQLPNYKKLLQALNESTFLFFQEEIGVRLFLLFESQRLGLTDSQSELENQIADQLGMLEAKLRNRMKNLVSRYSETEESDKNLPLEVRPLALSITQEYMEAALARLERFREEVSAQLKLKDPPASAQDLFERLGETDESFDLERAKRTYRRLARKYHPDSNPNDPVSEGLFKAYTEAWEILSDSDKLYRYRLAGWTLRALEAQTQKLNQQMKDWDDQMEEAARPWSRFFAACAVGSLACGFSEMIFHDLPWQAYFIAVPMAGFFIPEVERFKVERNPNLTNDEKSSIYIQGGVLRGLLTAACSQGLIMLATGRLFP